MRFSQILMVAAAGGGGVAVDPVDAWAAAVVAIGGSVSAGRVTLWKTFVAAEQASGAWPLTDDYFSDVAENVGQQLVSLKQRLTSVMVGSPSFVADAGQAYNGTTQYRDTGFICGTHGVAMSGANIRLAVYERTNVGTSNAYAAGTADSTTRNLRIIPRSAGNAFSCGINCATTTFASSQTDSRGFWSASHTAAPVFEGFKRGVSTGVVVPSSNGAVLPSFSLYIGALNNSGTAANFRGATEGLTIAGAALSSAQELAQYNAVQSFMTSVGANV